MIKNSLSRFLTQCGLTLLISISPTFVAAQGVTAEKEDQLKNDNGNGLADPGETVGYTVRVTNNNGANATTFRLQDVLDGRTTLAGTVKSNPLAMPDNILGLANVTLQIPASTGLISNDIDAENVVAVDGVRQFPGRAANFGLTATPATNQATSQGGLVTILANGSFTYVPPAGFTGNDTFSYTVVDGDAKTDSGIATVTVGGPVIWFVDSNAAPAGNGTQAAPFNTITSFRAANVDAAGDFIFVASSGGAYGTNTLVLKNNQQLIGQGSSLAAALSPTPIPSGATLPSVGSAPILNNGGGNAITLGANNTIRGLNIGNTSGIGLIGSNFGNLTVSQVAISGNGAAVSLTGGTASVEFSSVSATVSTANDGIDLINVAGTFTVSGQTTVNANGTGKGVDISGPGTGTINFNGGLAITTASNTGLQAGGGGSLNVPNSGITSVTSTGATAVDIQTTQIGGTGITFQSITVTGNSATVPGINLANTGSGNFTVTGTASTQGSGGSISGLVDTDAIRISNTSGLVSIANMNITNIAGSQDAIDTSNTYQSGADAIHAELVNGGLTLNGLVIDDISDCAINGAPLATPVTFNERTTLNGLAITNCTISDTNRFHIAGNVGDDLFSNFKESMVRIQGVSGQVTIDNNSFSRGSGLVQLVTADSGSVRMDVTRNDFTQSLKEFTSNQVSVGAAGLEVYVSGTVTADLIVGDLADASTTPGNTFLNCGKGDFGSLAVRLAPNAPPFTGDLDVHIARNTFRVTDHLTDAGVAYALTGFPQGDVEVVIGGPGSNCTYEALVSNNTFDGCQGDNASQYGASLTIIASDGATGESIVKNNTFENVWGHIARIDTSNATHFHQLINNTITPVNTAGNVAGTDLEQMGFGTTQKFPYESIVCLTRNGGVFHFEMQNQDIPDHDTAFNLRTDQSIEFQSASNSDQLFIDFDNGSGFNGFEFDNAVFATMNFFRDGSASGTLDGVIDDQGTSRNSNPSNVAGTVTLSNTSPTTPTVLVP